MAKSPPETEWPTQVQDAPTAVIEDGASAAAPPPVDPRRRALHDVWPWLLGLALLVIAGLVALWWFQYHHTSRRAGTGTTPVTQPTFAATTLATPTAKVAAPKVIGLTQAAAEARLAQAGLKPQAQAVKSLAASGMVIAQKPVPGTRVKRGAVVLLKVSRGKPALAVPDVTGQTAPQAVAALRKAGFLPLVLGVPSAQPKGTVVAEAPTAGTKAQAGSKVRLNISKGTPQPAGTTSPAPVGTSSTPVRTTSTPAPKPTSATVPNVSSLAIFPAIRTLEQAGLHSQVTLVQSSQPAGRVISQQPTARSKATKGQVVQLNVSLGPNPGAQTEVPDVTGQDVQQATQTLQQAGFTVQTVDRTVTGAT